MLFALKAEAVRHDIWSQVRTMLEFGAVVTGMVIIAAISAVLDTPEWDAVAIGSLILATLFVIIVVLLARTTYATWQRSLLDYQQSDEPPYPPTYYSIDDVA
ncbi:MAG: hypothetical protein JWN75_217 [Candidatus Saccharibacteria bacterium]|nr:hypothetical protein [Candidatus Saccharibacteria bacterium]